MGVPGTAHLVHRLAAKSLFRARIRISLYLGPVLIHDIALAPVW